MGLKMHYTHSKCTCNSKQINEKNLSPTKNKINNIYIWGTTFVTQSCLNGWKGK
jgi:hypothetical protein